MTNRVEGVFASKLGEPRGRFLAAVVEHALTVGRRKPTDFIRHFGPRDIMRALGEQAGLRAKILVSTTGVNEKVATRKTADSAGEDLEIALHEHVTTEDAIVALFDPDDRVRYLDHGRLWSFVTEGDFWKKPDAGSVAIVRAHVTYVIERARAEKLLTDREVVEGIGLDTLVASLPKEDVVKVLEAALGDGRSGKAFKDERVLAILEPAHLLEYVDIAHVWERVVAKLGFGPVTAEAVTRPPMAFVPEPMPTDDVVVSISGPSLELTVEEGEPLVDAGEDEEDAGTSAMDLEAMLARARASETPEALASNRPPAEEGIRSGLTSRPPR